MKLVFLQDVAGTADAGDIKDVKNGFARNYLIPKELAAPATATQIQRITNIRKVAGDRRQREAAEMRGVVEKVEGATIVMERKMGPTGRLYGSITSRHIALEVSKMMEREVDHRVVLLAQSIHEPGDYPVTLRMHRDVSVEVTISVVPEGFTQQQAAQEGIEQEKTTTVELEPVHTEMVQEQPAEDAFQNDIAAEETTQEEISLSEEQAQQ